MVSEKGTKHISDGTVADLLLRLLVKEYKIQSAFDKVIGKSAMAPF